MCIMLSWYYISDLAIIEERSKIDFNYVLQSANGNKTEIEKVLHHYQMNMADSLKYKAACFFLKDNRLIISSL